MHVMASNQSEIMSKHHNIFPQINSHFTQNPINYRAHGNKNGFQTNSISLPEITTFQRPSNTRKNFTVQNHYYNDIEKEKENLEFIKLRGTLHPKFTVLPPIGHKHNDTPNSKQNLRENMPSEALNPTKKKTNKSNKRKPTKTEENENSRKINNEIEHKTRDKNNKTLEKITENGKQANNNSDESKNNDFHSLFANSAQDVVEDNSKDQINYKEIYANMIDNSNMFFINDEEDYVVTSMPKECRDWWRDSGGPTYSKSKQNKYKEDKLAKDIIKWMQFRGRRNAICYEIDEIYRDLSSAVKHNLLVQHLEEIWMC